MLSKFINFIKARCRKFILDEYWIQDYIDLGMKVGKNCSFQPGFIVDVSHCWLIELGDKVRFGPHVYLLAHDGTTKRFVNYTRIGKIVIKDNVFIGARSMIMPGVTIGENSIIGANSTVTKSIPPNVVAAGSPAKVICSIEEHGTKVRESFEDAAVFSSAYTLRGGIDTHKKEEMKMSMKDRCGFVE